MPVSGTHHPTADGFVARVMHEGCVDDNFQLLLRRVGELLSSLLAAIDVHFFASPWPFGPLTGMDVVRFGLSAQQFIGTIANCAVAPP